MIAEVELLLHVAFAIVVVGYLISGIDDLVFDVVYWTRRALRGTFDPDVRLSELLAVPERRAAIFIPAWHEGEVVWETLLYNGEVIDYERYDIFVGTYPNDPETQRYVGMAREWLKNVHLSVVPRPGPTTKADNLNAMYRTMERREKILGVRYDFMVLHDAEDVLHPLELRLLNYHFARGAADMIQTPIFPLPAPVREVTAATYMDQFAEVQTKDLHVRGAIGGFVPSCGVATGFSRSALELLEEQGGGKPFDADALTEDYEVGLKLALAGMRGRYIRQRVIDDVPDREIRLNPVTPDPRRVATWANFPTRYKAAVRQRSRWALGIVFQSRRQKGTGSGLINRWLLFHDRKQLWAYPLVGAGYVILAIVVAGLVALHFGWAETVPMLRLSGLLWTATLVTAALMVNRLLQRALAVGRVYGAFQGALAIVRQPWDNLISIAALVRAASRYLKARASGEALGWDKTHHVAPTILRPRLGQLMIRRGWLTPDQLHTALMLQREEHKPLGDMLIDLGYITPDLRDEALEWQQRRAA